MKTLSCKDLCDPSCNFVAKGETDREIMDMMVARIKESTLMLKKADMEQMKSKIKTSQQLKDELKINSKAQQMVEPLN